jgi:hypothetical protein
MVCSTSIRAEIVNENKTVLEVALLACELTLILLREDGNENY